MRFRRFARAAHARRAQVAAGTQYAAALQQFLMSGFELVLFAVLVKLGKKTAELRTDVDELMRQQVQLRAEADALHVATEELRELSEQMKEQVMETKAEMEARLATIEATVAVHFALQQQLTETRIRKLETENAMLRALVGTRKDDSKE